MVHLEEGGITPKNGVKQPFEQEVIGEGEISPYLAGFSEQCANAAAVRDCGKQG